MLSESYRNRLLELAGVLSESKNNNIKDIINKHKEYFGDVYTFYSSKTNQRITSKVDLIYIRFGEPRKDKKGNISPSVRHVFGQEVETEHGVSVFEVFWDGEYIIFPDLSSKINSSFDELIQQNREIYLIDGEIDYNEEGADGEPLMIPSTVKVITKLPKEILFTEEEYVIKKMERGAF
jgi:hypothetical protein